ncbi:MAG: hypothetical protein JW841_14035 [Deltaproteobacteria bacterium]|nr:hypothetical protein [Deltaproteobacteria bacterium]
MLLFNRQTLALAALVLGMNCASCSDGDISSLAGLDAPTFQSFVANPTSVLVATPTDIVFLWTFAKTPSPEANCIIDNGVGSIANGAKVSLTLNKSTTFNIVCTNNSGSDTTQLTINVELTPIAPEIIGFTATPSEIPSDSPTNVVWKWSYANSPVPVPACSIDNGVGSVTNSTSTNVRLLDETTFTLKCENAGGSAEAHTNISTLNTLNLFTLGQGSGIITCGTGVCPTVVDPGETTVLTAKPAPDSTFEGWGGACSGTVSSCILNADSKLDVSATFTAKTPPTDIYWVSPTGNASWDGANSCKGETPLDGAAACSLATANAKVIAGNFVYLRGGTYHTAIAPKTSGTSSKRITFKGYSDERVVITGLDLAISLDDHAYITIDHITTDGNDEFAHLINASYIWLINSTLINSPDKTSVWIEGIRMYTDAKYNWLANNTIGNCGYSNDAKKDDIGGVMRFGFDGDSDDETSYNLLENNYLFHGGHHVIQISARYNIIRNNTCHNENWTPCNRALTGNLCGNRCIVLVDGSPDAYWNVFEGNRFGFEGGAIDDPVAAGGLSLRTKNNIVRRNEFIFEGGAGITLVASGVHDSSFDHIYHNVFYQNGNSPLNAGDQRHSAALLLDNWDGNSNPKPISGVAIKNNLFFNNSNDDIYFYYTDPADQIVSGNYFAQTSKTAVPGPNVESRADPMFTDVSAPADVDHISDFDFSLRDGSPAIDRGEYLTTTVGSGSGTELKVADAAYFIDGFGIVEGDRIQLEGQTIVAKIIAIDYNGNRLTLDPATPLDPWNDGQGVAMPYKGAKPDIGAWEK